MKPKETPQKEGIDIGKIANYILTFSLIILGIILVIQKVVMTPDITLDCQQIQEFNTEKELYIPEHNYTLKAFENGIGGQYDGDKTWKRHKQG